VNQLGSGPATGGSRREQRSAGMFGPAGTARAGGDDDQRIRYLHATYSRTREQSVRNEILAHYDDFAVRLARSFSTRREDRDDLIQVARLGLIHAVDRFDPDRERPFVVFARVTIVGELKRHLRDHTWKIRPHRSLQEQYLVVARTVDDLTQELGRCPGIPEIAGRAGLSEEQVLETMELAGADCMLSLDHPGGLDGKPLDPGGIDVRFAHVEDSQTLQRVISKLPERERQILHLRFEEELAQGEIASRIGVSQMLISRRLARLMDRMQAELASAY
jgi:RNA polymerase sigma-B factor